MRRPETLRRPLAGYVPGAQVAIALDPAASSFWDDGAYQLHGGHTSTQVLIDLYRDWCKRFPIVSIEDGLGEHDWDGFIAMNRALGDRIQIVGDDLYVTNTALIERGVAAEDEAPILACWRVQHPASMKPRRQSRGR